MPTKVKAKKPEAKKPVARKSAVKPPVVKASVARVAPVVEEKPPVVEMEDFKFGGYVVQAPKGCTPLYSESHPILGLTKVVFQTAMTAGDGRIGEPGGQYVWRK
jgi:hypothetical protein